MTRKNDHAVNFLRMLADSAYMEEYTPSELEREINSLADMVEDRNVTLPTDQFGYPWHCGDEFIAEGFKGKLTIQGMYWDGDYWMICDMDGNDHSEGSIKRDVVDSVRILASEIEAETKNDHVIEGNDKVDAKLRGWSERLRRICDQQIAGR